MKMECPVSGVASMTMWHDAVLINTMLACWFTSTRVLSASTAAALVGFVPRNQRDTETTARRSEVEARVTLLCYMRV